MDASLSDINREKEWMLLYTRAHSMLFVIRIVYYYGYWFVFHTVSAACTELTYSGYSCKFLGIIVWLIGTSPRCRFLESLWCSFNPFGSAQALQMCIQR